MHVEAENKLTIHTIGRSCNKGRPGAGCVIFEYNENTEYIG